MTLSVLRGMVESAITISGSLIMLYHIWRLISSGNLWPAERVRNLLGL